MQRRRRTSLHDRFITKVRVIPCGGCWEWTASLQPTGYGQINSGGDAPTMLYAHRVSWELFIGPIPEGMWIDHMCRNRLCVNPQHLRVVTPRQNTIENSRSVPAARAAQTTCSRGHPFDIVRASGARRCSICDDASARRRRESMGANGPVV